MTIYLFFYKATLRIFTIIKRMSDYLKAQSHPHSSIHVYENNKTSYIIILSWINEAFSIMTASGLFALARISDSFKGVMPTLDSPAVWVLLYFLINLFLTIHNKWIFQKLNFNFPWLLTSLHIGLTGIGSSIAIYKFNACKPKALSRKDSLSLMWFSLLYTINIAISNVSLKFVSLPFHQIVRSTGPGFTILLEMMMLQKYPSPFIYAPIAMVVLGVILTALGEYASISFDWLGFSLTLLGMVLASLKTITTNILMVGSLKLEPLDLLQRMTFYCVIQCFIYAWIFGEWSELLEYFQKYPIYKTENIPGTNEYTVVSHFFDYFQIFCNGVLAFFLNWISFTANKKTSALSMTIAANVKQVFSIVLAIFLFNTSITYKNGIGIFMTLLGGAIYSYLKFEDKQPKKPEYKALPNVEKPLLPA